MDSLLVELDHSIKSGGFATIVHSRDMLLLASAVRVWFNTISGNEDDVKLIQLFLDS